MHCHSGSTDFFLQEGKQSESLISQEDSITKHIYFLRTHTSFSPFCPVSQTVSFILYALKHFPLILTHTEPYVHH